MTIILKHIYNYEEFPASSFFHNLRTRSMFSLFGSIAMCYIAGIVRFLVECGEPLSSNCDRIVYCDVSFKYAEFFCVRFMFLIFHRLQSVA